MFGWTNVSFLPRQKRLPTTRIRCAVDDAFVKPAYLCRYHCIIYHRSQITGHVCLKGKGKRKEKGCSDVALSGDEDTDALQHR